MKKQDSMYNERLTVNDYSAIDKTAFYQRFWNVRKRRILLKTYFSKIGRFYYKSYSVDFTDICMGDVLLK